MELSERVRSLELELTRAEATLRTLVKSVATGTVVLMALWGYSNFVTIPFQAREALKSSAFQQVLEEGKQAVERLNTDAVTAGKTVSRLAEQDIIHQRHSASYNECTAELDAESLRQIESYSDFGGSGGSARTLLNITGKGCLVGGGVFGSFISDSKNGRNYSLRIKVDGVESIFPPRDAQAYARTSGQENTGVLVLPRLSFKESLSITYYTNGGSEVQITGYALVNRTE